MNSGIKAQVVPSYSIKRWNQAMSILLETLAQGTVNWIRWYDCRSM